MNRYKIYRTNYGIWSEFAVTFIFGNTFTGFLIYVTRTNIPWLLYLFSFYVARLTCYSLIDFLFTKEIIQSDEGLFIKVFSIKLKLDVNRCYTAVEISPIPEKYPTYYLILVRNDKNRFFRLFKNKLKLYPHDRNISLEGVAGKIETLFDIHYRGIDKSWRGLGYSDNNGDLTDKGYIP